MLLHELHYAEAREALDDERVVVLAHLEQFHDPGHRPHLVEVLGAGIFLLRLALGDDADHLVVANGILDQGDGLLPAHGQREHSAGEEHAVSQRQDGEDRRDVLLVDQARGCRGDDFAFLGHPCSPRPLWET